MGEVFFYIFSIEFTDTDSECFYIIERYAFRGVIEESIRKCEKTSDNKPKK